MKKGYKNDSICPCIFIKRSGSHFVIIVVYVDDLNLIGTSQGLSGAMNCLKKEFEMKDLGRTKFCLGLKIDHQKGGILLHQSIYMEKILNSFTWIKHIH
jgi:hypothetical protein